MDGQAGEKCIDQLTNTRGIQINFSALRIILKLLERHWLSVIVNWFAEFCKPPHIKKIAVNKKEDRFKSQHI